MWFGNFEKSAHYFFTGSIGIPLISLQFSVVCWVEGYGLQSWLTRKSCGRNLFSQKKCCSKRSIMAIGIPYAVGICTKQMMKFVLWLLLFAEKSNFVFYIGKSMQNQREIWGKTKGNSRKVKDFPSKFSSYGGDWEVRAWLILNCSDIPTQFFASTRRELLFMSVYLVVARQKSTLNYSRVQGIFGIFQTQDGSGSAF